MKNEMLLITKKDDEKLAIAKEAITKIYTSPSSFETCLLFKDNLGEKSDRQITIGGGDSINWVSIEEALSEIVDNSKKLKQKNEAIQVWFGDLVNLGYKGNLSVRVKKLFLDEKRPEEAKRILDDEDNEIPF